MSRIKLTSKRQATFPARLCEELGVAPGDELEVTPASVAGEAVWVLKPAAKTAPSWAGSLKRFAANARGDHAMKSIRESIAKGRAQE